MIESRCGIECSQCGVLLKGECKGCTNITKPFWGESCQVKSCCEDKGNRHCGRCTDFPCNLLNQFAYDEKEGDNGNRILRCRCWNSIYEDWRSYENQEFLLRPVRLIDAEELLEVYSDKEAQKRFNIDNFSHPCFFDTMEQMQNELEYYQKAYQEREFVRWSIVDKETGGIIGTVENFHREAIDQSTGEPRDAFHDVALLRLDIRSDYEKEPVFLSLIHLILESAYDDFECNCIATKAPQIAEERRRALVEAGFKASDAILVGHGGQNYGDYFIRKRFEC